MKIEKSKRGIPCVWESGGAYSNTGSSTIICTKGGDKKAAIYVKRSGDLACGCHALIPIQPEDVVIFASQHRGDFIISLHKIIKIDEDDAELSEFNEFSAGEWNSSNIPFLYESAINAAKEKAIAYHCKSAYFIANE